MYKYDYTNTNRQIHKYKYNTVYRAGIEEGGVTGHGGRSQPRSFLSFGLLCWQVIQPKGFSTQTEK